MTDTMGRMHSDAQFSGLSSVPAHVEVIGFMATIVGCIVAVAVVVEEGMNK